MCVLCLKLQSIKIKEGVFFKNNAKSYPQYLQYIEQIGMFYFAPTSNTGGIHIECIIYSAKLYYQHSKYSLHDLCIPQCTIVCVAMSITLDVENRYIGSRRWKKINMNIFMNKGSIIFYGKWYNVLWYKHKCTLLSMVRRINS